MKYLSEGYIVGGDFCCLANKSRISFFLTIPYLFAIETFE
jgi:hypothetical protein